MEIVYCDKCGVRIKDAQSAKDGNRMCEQCAPASSVPVSAGPVKRDSNRRLKPLASASIPKSTSVARDGAVPPGRSAQVVIGAGAFGLACFIAGFFIFSTSPVQNKSVTTAPVEPEHLKSPVAAPAELPRQTSSQTSESPKIAEAPLPSFLMLDDLDKGPTPREEYLKHHPKTDAKEPAESVSAGNPAANYGKPVKPLVWVDFEDGNPEMFGDSVTLVKGGFTAESKNALKVTPPRGFRVTPLTPNAKTVIRMAVWVSNDFKGVLIFSDTVDKKNVFYRLKTFEHGKWVLFKLPLKDFCYSDGTNLQLGHRVQTFVIAPSAGSIVIDDFTIYDE